MRFDLCTDIDLTKTIPSLYLDRARCGEEFELFFIDDSPVLLPSELCERVRNNQVILERTETSVCVREVQH